MNKLDESLSGAAQRPPPDPEGQQEDFRQRRIAEYSREALNKADALEANLGATNGDLFGMAQHLQDTIDEVIADDPYAMINTPEVLMPIIDAVLKAHRQIERTTKLILQLEKAASGKPGVSGTSG